MNSQKTILADCDGVLLNWNEAFHQWMTLNGFHLKDETEYSISKRYEISDNLGFSLVRLFNESSAMAHLKPFRDAVSAVRTLHSEHGYRFSVITSLSDSPDAAKLRRQNLYNVFGPEMWDDIICLPIGADKKSSLEKYPKGLWWIEDKPENAIAGQEVGMKPILIRHPHNDYSRALSVPQVDFWWEIVDIITG